MKVKYRIKEERSLDRVFGRESITFTVQAQVKNELGFGRPDVEETWHDVSGVYPMIVHAHNWLRDNEILETKYHTIQND